MKSLASILLEVAICVYKDAVAKCTAVNYDARDVNTITSRLEHEGLSFLTITLPKFGADFERSLASGFIEPCSFQAFKKASKGGRTPAFLQGIVARVFDHATGRILDEPSVEAVEGIRQIAYTFKKLLVDCSPIRVKSAIDGFKQCELDLESAISDTDREFFLEVSRVIWSDVFDRDILDHSLPKHGPGTTQEGLTGNRKYRLRRWHERLEPYFPFLGTLLSERSYGGKEFEAVTLVRDADEEPVRVVTVPKTLKGPRIIAIEPACMQYTQQLLAQSIIKSIESNRVTRGHVNFHDQGVNRSKALVSSRTESFATLDLSSASDRVPRDLALHMFDSIPHLRDAVDACRSRSAKLPDGEILHLRKFASMGSALCFPVESMYFYTICVAALLAKHNLPVTPSNVKRVARGVFVYGDDIVVPVDAAVVVSEYLARYKCKVNTAKSFWTGKFRESCGMDAFNGEEVTPTYLRYPPPRNKRSTSELISWVSTSNLFYRRGYWATASYLKREVEGIIGELPIVHDSSAGLGLVSFQGYLTIGRWGGRYQALEHKAWVPKAVYRKDTLQGYAALTKCLLSLESKGASSTPSSLDQQHLVRTARRGSVTLKRRWVPTL